MTCFIRSAHLDYKLVLELFVYFFPIFFAPKMFVFSVNSRIKNIEKFEKPRIIREIIIGLTIKNMSTL